MLAELLVDPNRIRPSSLYIKTSSMKPYSDEGNQLDMPQRNSVSGYHV